MSVLDMSLEDIAKMRFVSCFLSMFFLSISSLNVLFDRILLIVRSAANKSPRKSAKPAASSKPAAKKSSGPVRSGRAPRSEKKPYEKVTSQPPKTN